MAAKSKVSHPRLVATTERLIWHAFSSVIDDNRGNEDVTAISWQQVFTRAAPEDSC